MGVAEAVVALRRGGVCVFPTETVYGVGADATNAVAVERLFDLKGRPKDRAFSLCLGARFDPTTWAEFDERAARLAHAFWPGPLTLVVPRRGVIDAVTGGLPTVGLRVPDHPLAQELLEAFGGPLAAPSANLFGMPPPTRIEEVELPGVDVLLDGGPCRIGMSSTVLSLVGEARLLRLGSIGVDAIADVLGTPLAR